MVKKEILKDFQTNIGKAISGQELADRYAVSRNAVWKAVQTLRKEGYPILSDGKKGYYLDGAADLITEDGIRAWLPKDLFDENGRCRVQIFLYHEIDSTNLEARRMLANGFSGAALLIGERQTDGRGHNGSSFYSPASTGLYMTLILPVSLTAQQLPLVSRAAAAASVEAVQELTGNSLSIRKVNDLYAGSHKIGGILCEAMSDDLESERTQTVCIGIGINPATSLPPERTLEHHPASPGTEYSRSRLAAGITAKLMRTDFDHPDNFLKVYQRYHSSDIEEQHSSDKEEQ
ncbi:MAG: HTH domain-containing protein [Eubacterium sp.]|nr:HTH domain-containing protein [Eubacterium sp.]